MSFININSRAESGERSMLEERCRGGAQWFYWIAALSLLTSLLSLAGSKWGFATGLGVTRFVDIWANSVALHVGGGAKLVALVVNATIVGGFALCGYFAARRRSWIFAAGMGIYALDALLFLYVRDWLGVAFHAFVLYCLLTGFRACLKLNAASGDVDAPSLTTDRAETAVTT